MIQIERVDINSLTLDPANARKHPDKNLEAIKGSLNKFGQRKPIVVRDNVVIAGNGTLAAAKSLGWETIDIVRADDLSPTEATGFALADNKTSELAEWDDEILNKTLDSLLNEGFEVEDIGFDLDDIPGTGLSEPNEKDDEVPEVKDNPYGVKLGDIWQLGNHRLMCGDSTDKATVDKLMNGEKADMVFTDPPYNQSASSGGLTDKRPSFKKLIDSDLNNFDPELFLVILEYLDPGSAYIFTSKNLLAEYITWCTDKRNSWDLLVLSKSNPIPTKNNKYLSQCEWILFSRNKLPKWNNDAPFEYYKKVKEISVKPSEYGHPTEKQVAVINEFLQISSYQSDIIVDLFLGSGSTLIACEKTNRKCYGMEIDPHYCSVIIKRFEEYTGKKAERINCG
jgi:DNA modification methylase